MHIIKLNMKAARDFLNIYLLILTTDDSSLFFFLQGNISIVHRMTSESDTVLQMSDSRCCFYLKQ